MMFGTCAIVIGIGFLAIGILIMVRLRLYFYGFYYTFSCKLYASILALSLPMIARGVIDVCRFYIDEFDTAIKEDERYYRIFFYVFADFAPVVLQLASLVFGYIRA